ncbi:hypothetical protein CR513_02368, partial [Mucuna pruriens]
MYGEKVFDLSVIETILHSMTLRYDYVVCSIEESHDLNSMTIDELQSNLLELEQRMNGHNSHEEQALKVAQDEESSGHGRRRNVFQGGATRGRGRGRGGRQLMDMATNNAIIVMSSNIFRFSSIDSSFPDEVKLGNNYALKVAAKGTIKLLIDEVNNVFYVLELKNNLFIMGQFLEKGLSIGMKQNKCEVFHGENLIFETFMATNRMFAISVKSRLSHNFFEVSSMPPAQHDIVKGLPIFKSPTQLCEHCPKGKHQRDPFPQQSNWCASQLLQLIHSNICGPINPTSNGNKRYVLPFIDDLSGKVLVYFLVGKGEALDVFKKFKALVEKQGIQRQLTTSYMSQQNGVGKRKNQTIISMKEEFHDLFGLKL